MEKIKNNINLYIKIIIILCFAIMFFIINKGATYVDDVVFREAFNNLSTFKIWLSEYYSTWSGRIVTSALSTIFLRMPIIIYRILNTTVFVIAIISIFEIAKSFGKTSPKKQITVLSIIFTLFFIIDDRVIKDGALWVMASFIYMWPTAFMFVALIPFVKHLNNIDEKQIWFVPYILADFVACFSEQPALVLLCFGGLTIIYSLVTKQKINKLLLIHFIVIVVLTLIEMLAPGNFVRVNASTLRRYPTFYMLSVGDKMLEGVIVLANQMLSFDKVLMIILTIMISINIIIDKRKTKLLKVISIIPAGYFCLVRF